MQDFIENGQAESLYRLKQIIDSLPKKEFLSVPMRTKKGTYKMKDDLIEF
jgi:hypothetical protein